ncbi:MULTISPECIES: helix-turn-helix domain-containing protein [Haematobacter]|nr:MULTISPECIES: helix-turn-helix transcriptional regulator [Haematobacter]
MLLAEREMNLSELARELDVPYHRLQPWFRRPKALPKGPDLYAIAQFFNVDEGYLLHGGDRRPFNRLASLQARAKLLDEAGQRDLANFLDYLLARQEGSDKDPSK